MLTSALKWLTMLNMAMTYLMPLITLQMRSKGEAPDWMEDALSLINQLAVNAKAGVEFDDALAGRIQRRLKALPVKPTKADFTALSAAIRESYADFKSVMAARRAR